MTKISTCLSPDGCEHYVRVSEESVRVSEESSPNKVNNNATDYVIDGLPAAFT